MTPQELAALHRACFTSPPPWSAQSFADLCDSKHDFLLIAPDKAGLIAGRVIAGECELLTLATDPRHQRQGVATILLARFEAEARARGATEVFLEVDEANTAARALYARHGFSQTGCRAGYYVKGDGAASDALILCKSLG